MREKPDPPANTAVANQKAYMPLLEALLSIKEDSEYGLMWIGL